MKNFSDNIVYETENTSTGVGPGRLLSQERTCQDGQRHILHTSLVTAGDSFTCEMTPQDEQRIAELLAQAQALRERAAVLERQMQARWDNAPGAFVTGSAGRRRSGLAKRSERADSANRNAYAKVKALKARAARLVSQADAIQNAEAVAASRQASKVAGAQARQEKQADLKAGPLAERLFCGVYPTGWVWCDKGQEQGGDYRKLAYMSFTKLVLELAPGCPAIWKPILEAKAAELQARRGQWYQTSTCGQGITLWE